MAWSEIKKAVNSDISTPLNVQILNALNSGKIIKRIQRGTWQGTRVTGGYGTLVIDGVTISLQGFENANKMIALIEYDSMLPGTFSYDSSNDSGTFGEKTLFPYVSALSIDSLIISNACASYHSWDLLKTQVSVSGTYTVIEFY